jgi:hypothetical protein
MLIGYARVSTLDSLKEAGARRSSPITSPTPKPNVLALPML